MAQLWTQNRDGESGERIKNIDAGGLTLEKPTLVFLAGLFNTPKQPTMIRGAIGHLIGMLRNFGERAGETCEIHTVCYKSRRSNLCHFFNYNSRPNTYASQEARQFVYDYMLPHFADNCQFDEKGQFVSGDKKPLRDVEKAFKNLTFMAYSYGTVFSQEVYNAAKKTMEAAGFEKSDSRYLLSRIHLVSMGCVSRPLREQNRYTSICLVATNDFVSSLKRYVWPSLKEAFATVANKLKISDLSRRNLYIAAPVKRRISEVITLDDGRKIEKRVPLLFPKWSPIASHHELHHYTTDQDDSNQFAKIVRFALVNCLRRDKALKGIEMIAPPPEMSVEAERYQARIERALARKKQIRHKRRKN